jgi:hypothetical protein
MSKLRIWHLMVIVIAAAVLAGAMRVDQVQSCTPLSPLVLLVYLCGALGFYGARLRGRRARTGLLVGMLLGPLGVIWAFSNPIPERFRQPRRGSARQDHEAPKVANKADDAI